MDHVNFPYRSSSHLVLLHVVAESGAWEKHGLHVDYDKKISSSEAHRDVPSGAVEFVGGNHISTYGHRARGDDRAVDRVRGLERGNDAFHAREELERLQRLVVGGVGVFHAADVVQIGVLGADGGVVETCGNGVGQLDLAVGVGEQPGLGALQHAELAALEPCGVFAGITHTSPFFTGRVMPPMR